MKSDSVVCVKCGSDMSEGFILNAGLRAAAGASAWQAGDPEPSFWTGTRHVGKEKHPITVYRCAGCGYLESYAR